MTHSREHEELLERVLAHELERSDERVVAVVRACAQCRSELEELGEVLALAEGAGRVQRSVLEEARAGKDVVDAKWAQRVLERRATPGTPRASPARWPAWIVAAAAGLALVLFLFRRTRDETGSTLLGDHALELVQPVGASADLSLFSWRGDLPPSGYYALWVWERPSQGGERLLFQEPHLETNTWQAAPESIGSARSIRWSVEVYDAGGVPVGSDQALAELSP